MWHDGKRGQRHLLAAREFVADRDSADVVLQLERGRDGPRLRCCSSLHRGGTATSAMRLDMDRPPRPRRGEPLSGIRLRLETVDLERLKPHREAWQRETPAAPPRQEWGGLAAAGIETAKVSC